MDLIWCPRFAPLALPLATALFTAHLPHLSAPTPTPIMAAALTAATTAAHTTALALLTDQLGHLRATTTLALLPDRPQHGVAVSRAMYHLQLTGAVGRTVLSRWRAMGLLTPPTARSPIHADGLVALMLTRALWPPRERIHVPEIPSTEPRWWCWRQDTPDAPILPCPVPLPPDVPPTARLWSPWAGAPWIDARIVVDDTAP